MTLQQKGAYMDLLCLQWSQGEINQDDIDFVCKSLTAEDKARVLRKFKPSGINTFQNERLESERQKQIAYREKQSNNGKASAQARLNHRSTTVQPSGEPKPNSPSPSPSPSPIINTHTSASFPEANVPDLAEVLKQASLSAVTPESATKFFNHHQDNQLWVNQFGRLIDWKSKLVNWQTNDRQPKPTNATNRPTAPDRNAGTYNNQPLSAAARAKVL